MTMDPAHRATLLWGVVSLLAFLVLIQGYELLADERVAVDVKAVVALLAGAGGAGVAHVTRERLLAPST